MIQKKTQASMFFLSTNFKGRYLYCYEEPIQIPFYVLSLLLDIIGPQTEENQETMAAGGNGAENYHTYNLNCCSCFN